MQAVITAEKIESVLMFAGGQNIELCIFTEKVTRECLISGCNGQCVILDCGSKA